MRERKREKKSRVDSFSEKCFSFFTFRIPSFVEIQSLLCSKIKTNVAPRREREREKKREEQQKVEKRRVFFFFFYKKNTFLQTLCMLRAALCCFFSPRALKTGNKEERVKKKEVRRHKPPAPLTTTTKKEGGKKPVKRSLKSSSLFIFSFPPAKNLVFLFRRVFFSFESPLFSSLPLIHSSSAAALLPVNTFSLNRYLFFLVLRSEGKASAFFVVVVANLLSFRVAFWFLSKSV